MLDVAAVIISRNGAAKIAAPILSAKPWAGTVHVFVDRATTDATREVAAAHGAQVHDIVTPGFVEGALEEAHRVPGTRFVLRLDDDERLTLPPGTDPATHRANLLGAMDAHGFTHLWFRRRWFLPGETHYIANAPWYPDPQMRLVDLHRGTVTWPTRPHDAIHVTGPEAMCPDACIDHLDFCHTTAEQRRAKAAAYTARNPGSAANEAYYKFEDFQLVVAPAAALEPAG